MEDLTKRLAEGSDANLTNLVLACGAIAIECDEDICGIEPFHGGDDGIFIYGHRGVIHLTMNVSTPPFRIKYVSRRDDLSSALNVYDIHDVVEAVKRGLRYGELGVPA